MAVRCSSSVPDFSKVKQCAVELLWFQYLTYWPGTCTTYSAAPSGHFLNLNSVNFSIPDFCSYIMSCCDLDFWPRDLERSCHTFKLHTMFEVNWLSYNLTDFRRRCVTLWPWPLTSWYWNPTISGWVINDLLILKPLLFLVFCRF